MALAFEICEPTALAEGGSFIYDSFKKNPKLALSAHKGRAIGLAPLHRTASAVPLLGRYQIVGSFRYFFEDI